MSREQRSFTPLLMLCPVCLPGIILDSWCAPFACQGSSWTHGMTHLPARDHPRLMVYPVCLPGIDLDSAPVIMDERVWHELY